MENNLKKFQDISFDTVDIDTLADIQHVVIDESKPKPERIASFIEQIKNPYCFRCGDMVVKVNFASGGDTMEKQIEKIILS